MKKTIFWIVSLLIILGIAFYILLYPKLEIVSGYNAKVLCSCIFVSGIDQATAEDVDLGYTVLWLSSNEVDLEEKRVHSNVLGMHPKTAVYRDGLGCTLVNDNSVASVMEQTVDLSKIQYAKEIWNIERVNGSEAMQAALQKAFDKEGENTMQTRAIIAVKDGKIIGEAYAKGIDHNMPLLGWSMTKSITSALSGILNRQGIWNLQESMPISGWKDDERREITLENMLHMSSGLRWTEDYGNDSKITIMLYTVGNMGAFAADVPLEEKPGAAWKYSSGTTNIIAGNMADVFDSKPQYWQFPYRELFAPLGMKSFVMETDASGHFVGSSYSYGTARDWAKLGMLYLNQGNWYGKQILDSTWVEFSHTEAPASNGEYGGHFWLNRAKTYEKYEDDAYWMGGYQGQQVSIHPSENMVVVRLGVTYERGDFDFSKIIGGIVEAAKD